MRKLRKAPVPEKVARKLQTLKAKLQPHLPEVPEDLKSAYRFKGLREALTAEAHRKCVYCESKILSITRGDIEHIKPKSKFPAEMFDYDNLTLACPECNNSKSDYHDPQALLINPFVNQPEQHLASEGPFFFSVGSKGKTALLVLDLNRVDLIEQRLERLKGIMHMVETWKQMKSDDLKARLEKQILAEAEVDKAFSLMVKCVIKHHLQ